MFTLQWQPFQFNRWRKVSFFTPWGQQVNVENVWEGPNLVPPRIRMIPSTRNFRESTFNPIEVYEKILPTEIEFEAVADPGFPGGRQLPRGVHQFLLCKSFAKICMKMKEFGGGYMWIFEWAIVNWFWLNHGDGWTFTSMVAKIGSPTFYTTV